MTSSNPTPRPPRGGGPLRVLLPVIGVPLVGMMAYNYFKRDHPLKTPGVANIERAMTSGGGTSTHIPAYGGTPRGSQTDEGTSISEDGKTRRRAGGGEAEGKRFERTNRDGDIAHGEEQRPVQPTAVGKSWNELKYGNGNGK